MKRTSAQRLYTGIAVSMTMIVFLLWWYITRWHIVVLYFCAINVTTLLLYAWDKIAALLNSKEGGRGHEAKHYSSVTRVPEVVLHGSSLAGGSPMALVAQKVFHHKTRKRSFQVWHYVVLAVQAMLIIAYFYGTSLL